MKTNKSNRLLALFLCLMMLLGTVPLSGIAFAAAPCPNHTAHDAACGYIEAVEGHACGHTHDEACGYSEGKEGVPCKHEQGEHDESCGYMEGAEEIPCDKGCSEADGDGAIVHAEGCAYTPAVEGAACSHEKHDGSCGYAEAVAGAACRHEHDTACGYVEAVEGHVCGHTCELCNGTEKVVLFEEIQTATYLISGQVTYQSLYEKIILSGITVTLWQDGAQVNSTTTDQEGKYTFAALNPGKYEVKAGGQASDGLYYAEDSWSVTISDRDAIDWDFNLNPGNAPDTYSISGRVQKAGTTDDLIIGVTLWQGDQKIGEALTDIMGKYSFTSLAPGTYTVKAGGEISGDVYYAEQSQTVTIGETNPEGRCLFDLEPGNLPGTYSISGRVRKAGTVDLDLVGLIIGVTLWKDGNQVGAVNTNEPHGDYAFTTLAPGTYTVKAGGWSGGVYYAEQSQTVTIGETNPEESCLFRLEPGRVPGTYLVSGSVILPGISYATPDIPVELWHDGQKITSTVTFLDSSIISSEFELFAEPGNYTLRIPAGTYAGTYCLEYRTSVVVGSQDTNVPIELKPGTAPTSYTVSGKVLNSAGSGLQGIPVQLLNADIKVSETTTGVNGDYTITQVNDGEYTLKVPDGTYGGTVYQAATKAITVNGQNVSAANLTLTAATTAPTAPVNFTVTPGHQQAVLSWTAPNDDGGSSVIKYQYSAAANGAENWQDIPGSNASTTSYTVTGLTGGTKYTFKVRAVNGVGAGAAATATATPTVPGPSAPQNFNTTYANTILNLYWKAPASDGGLPIVKYQYSIAEEGAPDDWRDIPNSNASTTSYTVTGLTNFTTYTVKLRAVNSTSVGEAVSDTFYLEPSSPGAVRNLTAIPGDGQMTLTWEKPENDGGSPITHYQYRYNVDPNSSGAANQWSRIPDSGPDTVSFTITGLENGVELAFWVRAYSAYGMGDRAMVMATPQAVSTVPTAPQNFKAIPGDKQVSLSWEAPASDGGAEITGYEVSKDNGTSWAAATSATGHTFDNLTNGQSYTFQVRAVNGAGTGAVATQTATPQAATYILTVENGTDVTSSGPYSAGERVTIRANAPADGKLFDRWTTSGGGSFASATSAETIFTMPAGNATVTATYKNDETAPTGEIKVNNNSWRQFLSAITFNLFFKETQEVTITANDNSGQGVAISYYKSDTALTLEQVEALTDSAWTAYTGKIRIAPDDKLVIYARLTDKAGNVSYISSDGMVLDATPPVIQGAEHGKTYTEAKTITVSDDYLKEVTVGSEVKTIKDNACTFTLDSNGTYTITAVDKAGNTTEITVTIEIPVVISPNLTGITNPEAITGIANGTPLADISLPDKVEISTTEGNKQANVTWNRDTATYDPASKAAQTFTISGDVTLPGGVTNTGNIPLSVQISITVAAEDANVITGIQIASMANKTTYTEGDALDLTGLTVKLTFSKSGEKTVALADFGANHITVSPANGAKLSMRDTTVTVSAGGKSTSFTITIKVMQQVQPLVFSPVAGTYDSAQSVEITCGTTGAKIYYTTDGSDPITTSTLYTNPINVDSTTTIKAVAIKEGMKDSAVASATYTIKATSPHTHSYTGGWLSDGGGHWKVCNVCGEPGVKTAHSGGTATCHTYAVCTVCGASYGALNLKNHDGGTEIRDQKQATETEEGYTGDTYCLGCGEKIETGSVIPKLTPGHTHSYGGWVTDGTWHWRECSCGEPKDKAAHSGGTATCHTYAVCTTCGASYGVLNPAIHDGGTEIRNQKAATEAEEGYTGDTYCLGCGVKIGTGSVIPKLTPGHTHSYGGWVSDGARHWRECSCGEPKDKAAHSGGTATCHTYAVCTVCGASYGALNPAIHDGGTEIRNQKAATETEEGYTGDTYCLGCGVKIGTGSVIPKLKPSPGPGPDPDPSPDPGPSDPDYTEQTLRDPDSNIQVSGSFTKDAKLEIKERLLHTAGACDVCDEIRARQDNGKLIVLYDISLISGSFTGDITVEIPVGKQYNGQTVIILHCKDKIMDSRTLTVRNGVAKGTFSSLSPFAVVEATDGVAVTGLPESYTLLVGQSVSWTPKPAGGEWSYDKDLLEMTKNGDTYTFKALKTGKATATYTVNGVPHTVTITINSSIIPQTGDTGNTWSWALLMLAALLGCGGLLAYRRLDSKKRHG